MNEKRIAIIAGMRTPFVRAGEQFARLTFLDLASHAARSLIDRAGIEGAQVEEVCFGSVLLDPRTPNWARELVFKVGLPKSVYAYSVSNNCISSLVAAAASADRIGRGLISSAVAGGAESMSNPAVLFTRRSSSIFAKLARAKTTADRLKTLTLLRPRDLWPDSPAFKEPSTGLSMGEHMEITAKELGISRKIQDEIAFNSHQSAVRGLDRGLLQQEIASFEGVTADSFVRRDTSLEKLGKLRPVFDRSAQGTITAGNSSPLTDGASAVLLMSEERAKELGLEPLAYLRAVEFAAVDPNRGLLMAPGIAVPKLLKRLSLSFSDFDLIEVHEAFGAQVEANIKAWEEGMFEAPLGPFPREKMNLLGGSIALGHPFAATGTRIITTVANELKRRGNGRALISICAAGAMAAAAVVER